MSSGGSRDDLHDLGHVSWVGSICDVQILLNKSQNDRLGSTVDDLNDLDRDLLVRRATTLYTPYAGHFGLVL